jgi:nitroreductase
LQPFKVIEITNPELREELKAISWNQSQITDASHLFVFCNVVEVKESDVDEMMELKSKINHIPLEKVKGYGTFVKGKLKEKSSVELFHWSAKQTYLALSNALNACAALQIDCTPMEGFEVDAVNEKLGLSEKNLNACVFLAVGYRHSEDTAQKNHKVRKPLESLFEVI